jgi:hypothetical protein
MFRGLRIFAAVVLFSLPAAAQTATGVLIGRVTDASSSAVPQAKITIQNEATGVAQTVTSNAEGNFQQSYLCPAIISNRRKGRFRQVGDSPHPR